MEAEASTLSNGDAGSSPPSAEHSKAHAGAKRNAKKEKDEVIGTGKPGVAAPSTARSGEVAQSVDLVFLLVGSDRRQRKVIDILRSKLHVTADIIRKKHPDVNIKVALIDYRNHDYALVADLQPLGSEAFGKSLDSGISEIDGEREAQDVLQGLRKVPLASWSAGTRVLVHVADAPAAAAAGSDAASVQAIRASRVALLRDLRIRCELQVYYFAYFQDSTLQLAEEMHTDWGDELGGRLVSEKLDDPEVLPTRIAELILQPLQAQAAAATASASKAAAAKATAAAATAKAAAATSAAAAAKAAAAAAVGDVAAAAEAAAAAAAAAATGEAASVDATAASKAAAAACANAALAAAAYPSDSTAAAAASATADLAAATADAATATAFASIAVAAKAFAVDAAASARSVDNSAKDVDIAFLVEGTDRQKEVLEVLRHKLRITDQMVKEVYPNVRINVAYVSYRRQDYTVIAELQPLGNKTFDKLLSSALSELTRAKDVLQCVEKVPFMSWTAGTRLLVQVADTPSAGNDTAAYTQTNRAGDRGLLWRLRVQCELKAYYFAYFKDDTRQLIQQMERDCQDAPNWLVSEQLQDPGVLPTKIAQLILRLLRDKAAVAASFSATATATAAASAASKAAAEAKAAAKVAAAEAKAAARFAAAGDIAGAVRAAGNAADAATIARAATATAAAASSSANAAAEAFVSSSYAATVTAAATAAAVAFAEASAAANAASEHAKAAAKAAASATDAVTKIAATAAASAAAAAFRASAAAAAAARASAATITASTAAATAASETITATDLAAARSAADAAAAAAAAAKQEAAAATTSAATARDAATDAARAADAATAASESAATTGFTATATITAKYAASARASAASAEAAAKAAEKDAAATSAAVSSAADSAATAAAEVKRRAKAAAAAEAAVAAAAAAAAAAAEAAIAAANAARDAATNSAAAIAACTAAIALATEATTTEDAKTATSAAAGAATAAAHSKTAAAAATLAAMSASEAAADATAAADRAVTASTSAAVAAAADASAVAATAAAAAAAAASATEASSSASTAAKDAAAGAEAADLASAAAARAARAASAANIAHAIAIAEAAAAAALAAAASSTADAASAACAAADAAAAANAAAVASASTAAAAVDATLTSGAAASASTASTVAYIAAGAAARAAAAAVAAAADTATAADAAVAAAADAAAADGPAAAAAAAAAATAASDAASAAAAAAAAAAMDAAAAADMAACAAADARAAAVTAIAAAYAADQAKTVAVAVAGVAAAEEAFAVAFPGKPLRQCILVGDAPMLPWSARALEHFKAEMKSAPFVLADPEDVPLTARLDAVFSMPQELWPALPPGALYCLEISDPRASGQFLQHRDFPTTKVRIGTYFGKWGRHLVDYVVAWQPTPRAETAWQQLAAAVGGSRQPHAPATLPCWEPRQVVAHTTNGEYQYGGTRMRFRGPQSTRPDAEAVEWSDAHGVELVDTKAAHEAAPRNSDKDRDARLIFPPHPNIWGEMARGPLVANMRTRGGGAYVHHVNYDNSGLRTSCGRRVPAGYFFSLIPNEPAKLPQVPGGAAASDGGASPGARIRPTSSVGRAIAAARQSRRALPTTAAAAASAVTAAELLLVQFPGPPLPDDDSSSGSTGAGTTAAESGAQTVTPAAAGSCTSSSTAGPVGETRSSSERPPPPGSIAGSGSGSGSESSRRPSRPSGQQTSSSSSAAAASSTMSTTTTPTTPAAWATSTSAASASAHESLLNQSSSIDSAARPLPTLPLPLPLQDGGLLAGLSPPATPTSHKVGGNSSIGEPSTAAAATAVAGGGGGGKAPAAAPPALAAVDLVSLTPSDRWTTYDVPFHHPIHAARATELGTDLSKASGRGGVRTFSDAAAVMKVAEEELRLPRAFVPGPLVLRSWADVPRIYAEHMEAARQLMPVTELDNYASSKLHMLIHHLQCAATLENDRLDAKLLLLPQMARLGRRSAEIDVWLQAIVENASYLYDTLEIADESRWPPPSPADVQPLVAAAAAAEHRQQRPQLQRQLPDAANRPKVVQLMRSSLDPSSCLALAKLSPEAAAAPSAAHQSPAGDGGWMFPDPLKGTSHAPLSRVNVTAQPRPPLRAARVVPAAVVTPTEWSAITAIMDSTRHAELLDAWTRLKPLMTGTSAGEAKGEGCNRSGQQAASSVVAHATSSGFGHVKPPLVLATLAATSSSAAPDPFGHGPLNRDLLDVLLHQPSAKLLPGRHRGYRGEGPPLRPELAAAEMPAAAAVHRFERYRGADDDDTPLSPIYDQADVWNYGSKAGLLERAAVAEERSRAAAEAAEALRRLLWVGAGSKGRDQVLEEALRAAESVIRSLGQH
ncbi:hypothetical protein PLESTF_000761900 [Pleodorina starrii]|nr:hypothetical protein PLESTM_001340700 [Pleodorina starrii]GLC68947.1 hypothetical protein PLESTF_000761900 [Pleodorina starrii]